MTSRQAAPAAGAKVDGNGEQRTPAAAAAGASEELLPMLHQVGGHRAASDEEAPYMLRLRPHLVLKVVQDGARGERELSFYRRLFPEVDGGGDGDGGGQSPGGGGEDGDSLAFLRPFVPAFYGVRIIQSPPHRADAPLLQYLALEDIADRDRHLPMPPSPSPQQRSAPSLGRTGDKSSREQRPSVLDIKMGRATHGPFASPGKAARERGKYPHQAEVGFRVIGMKVYDRAAGEYETEDKAYGRGLTPDGIDDALARFFLRRCCPSQPPPQATSDDTCLSPSPPTQASSDDKEGRTNGSLRRTSRGKGKRAAATELLDFYVERLEALHDWFQGQRLARFWSSSLLFVDHEEESSDEEEEEEGEKEGGRRMVADVRMIDFAHVELVGERNGDGAAELAQSTPVAEDENYVYGLVSLLEHLRRLRKRAAAVEQAAAIGESGEG